MFATIPNPIPARMKGLNRAEICDVNFTEFVKAWSGDAQPRPVDHEAILEGSALDARDFRELFESPVISRHLDLMARVLRVQNKVFYTIGSSGHEGNAMVARATRHTDPAFLHYRSGGFMAERFRKLPGMDPVMDSALSFAASKDDPASGGRHKVWGSKPLWVLPQTSTIASHLTKALGTAIAIEQARRIGHALSVPEDSIAICSFGDASLNHSTSQGAIHAASLEDVAQFVFTDLADSYAARTGRPDNVGVIGAAVFEEARPIYETPAPIGPADDSLARQRTARAQAPTASMESAEREPQRQGLGTGHGDREWSPVSRTGFARASRVPVQVTELRYDERHALIARGVLRPEPHRRWYGETPRAFPDGFVADPPRW